MIPEQSELFSESDIEPRYLHRAIQNLVGNACRYATGKVRVSCLLDEQNCRVDVEDDGPGIPEQEWEKVFSAFARLDDSRTRNSGATGWVCPLFAVSCSGTVASPLSVVATIWGRKVQPGLATPTVMYGL